MLHGYVTEVDTDKIVHVATVMIIWFNTQPKINSVDKSLFPYVHIAYFVIRIAYYKLHIYCGKRMSVFSFFTETQNVQYGPNYTQYRIRTKIYGHMDTFLTS